MLSVQRESSGSILGSQGLLDNFWIWVIGLKDNWSIVKVPIKWLSNTLPFCPFAFRSNGCNFFYHRSLHELSTYQSFHQVSKLTFRAPSWLCLFPVYSLLIRKYLWRLNNARSQEMIVRTIQRDVLVLVFQKVYFALDCVHNSRMSVFGSKNQTMNFN